MTSAWADEATDAGTEFVGGVGFWESVCLAFGDIDIDYDVTEFDADYPVDYTAVDQEQSLAELFTD
jgi:hypothetical protein